MSKHPSDSLPALPVRETLPALSAALADKGCAVLAAPPGSGKTTLIPLLLKDQPWLLQQRILMLEPRRIAARAAAARMASLLGEQAGDTVGYQVRFDRRIGPRTRIEVLTEGLLTRRLQGDAELPGVGLVIFDEFHERSLEADLALALTLDVRANLRSDLRVLVMSATLDTSRVARLLGGAPVIQSEGRSYPVEVRHLSLRDTEKHGAMVAQGVVRALEETAGDILAFLPGGREIRQAQRVLESSASVASGLMRIFPLYGDLPAEQQDAALQPLPGQRKVILATNIAQTSLTVEGVTTVVDGGLVRSARFDLGAGANRLETRRVSRASADQRAGRAGRLGPGRCYRLWSSEQQATLAAHDTPEILAADLTRLALELAVWGADPGDLSLLDVPPAVAWNHARDLLQQLGALDAGGRITAHGRQLATLPLPPRRAHLLVLARQQGLTELAAWAMALLDERDDVAGGRDLAETVAAARAGRGDPRSLRRLRETVGQLLRQPGTQSESKKGRPSSEDGATLGRLLSWAYPERIARRRAEPKPGDREVRYLCADGVELQVPAADSLSRAEWLAVAHWDPGPPRSLRSGAGLDESAIRQDHAAMIRKLRVVRWHTQSDCVIAEEQERLGAILLGSRPLRDAGDDAVQAMLDGVRALGIPALPWSDELRQWQARVLCLRGWRSAEGWPDVSDAALLAALEDWLAPFLAGVTRREHLARLDLSAILHTLLDPGQQQRLARLVPTHLDVPSGSRLRVQYETDKAPVLEVKLQEMFGCADTPCVNEGRMPVTLHLLSPAQRPLAVTQDLAGFWRGAYLEVKKEMKGRYPRHPWPDDPMTALPTRRAKPRGT